MSHIKWTDHSKRPDVPQRIVELQRQLVQPAEPLPGARIPSKRRRRRNTLPKEKWDRLNPISQQETTLPLARTYLEPEHTQL